MEKLKVLLVVGLLTSGMHIHHSGLMAMQDDGAKHDDGVAQATGCWAGCQACWSAFWPECLKCMKVTAEVVGPVLLAIGEELVQAELGNQTSGVLSALQDDGQHDALGVLLALAKDQKVQDAALKSCKDVLAQYKGGDALMKGDSIHPDVKPVVATLITPQSSRARGDEENSTFKVWTLAEAIEAGMITEVEGKKK